jgi:type I restriction enzyme S subunit
MSNRWQEVPLGQLLVRSDDLVDLIPTEQYMEVTIRLWGKGVVLLLSAV